MSALAVLVGTVGPAQAAGEDTPGTSNSTNLSAPASQAAYSQIAYGNVNCDTGEPGTGCQSQFEAYVSAPSKANGPIIESDPNLSPAAKAEIRSLQAAGLVFYYRTWTTGVQSTLKGILFREKHSGGYYYGNGKVWSTTAQYGYKGWHTCDLGSGFAYSIKVTQCITRPRPELGTNVIAEYDYFQVHVIAKGIPIYDSKSSWANLYPSGAAYFHWMN